jgi:hypothetical protein
MNLHTLLELGDIALTAPAAAAISSWMVAARAWRMALRWALLFALAVGLVGVSKIAFLGWGTGVPALQFRALSGHATGVMAVYPMLFYLLLQGCPDTLRHAGAVLGVVLGGAVATLLVWLGEHTVAETLAGCALGALVSIGGIRLARQLPMATSLAMPACALLAFAGAVWLMEYAHLGWWMIKAARLLSGNRATHALDGAPLE